MAKQFYLVEAKDTKGSFVSAGVAYESKDRAKALAKSKGVDERGDKLGRVSTITILWEER